MYTTSKKFHWLDQLWKEYLTNDGWRRWKYRKDWPHTPESPQWDQLDKELASRSITIEESLNILRWGYTTKVTLTIQEAYRLMEGWGQGNQQPLWKIYGKGSAVLRLPYSSGFSVEVEY